ncbi:MAG: response regulator transcription factor [Bacteroidota bacterium]
MAKKRITQTITLLLADDHPIVREGIKFSLAANRTIRVIGEASNGREAVTLARKLRPDVILMDIQMPEMSGLEATKLVVKFVPGTKILALTTHDNREYIVNMTKLGAKGYVFKDTPPSELVKAIETVYSGGVYYSPGAGQVLMEELTQPSIHSGKNPLSQLSSREVEVLRLIVIGVTTKDIAQRLTVSLRTVHAHKEHITKKLGVANIAGLTKIALREGIITLDDIAKKNPTDS